METAPIVEQRENSFTIRYDESRGLVLFEIIGFLTSEESKWCNAVLRTQWDKARARHGRVLLLVDASNSQVQASTIIGDLRGSSSWAGVPGDRVAFVVSSSLVKLQLKRTAGESEAAVDFFISASAANTWLLAHEGS